MSGRDKGCIKRYQGILKPKVKHPDEVSARVHAEEARARTGDYYDVYLCATCSFWHVGHLRSRYSTKSYLGRYDEVLVGKLIAALKHVINGDPLPRRKIPTPAT